MLEERVTGLIAQINIFKYNMFFNKLKDIVTMDIATIKKFIQKNKVRHLSNKVLHTHPSPKMWKTDLKEEENNYLLKNTEAKYKSINLYLGIPYCIPTNPPHCGFCLSLLKTTKEKKR